MQKNKLLTTASTVAGPTVLRAEEAACLTEVASRLAGEVGLTSEPGSGPASVDEPEAFVFSWRQKTTGGRIKDTAR
jgi:hypothetical protein